MRRSIRTSYTHTILASYLGYITQAVVNNFAPLLFLTFRSQMGLTLEQITLLTTLNFSIQLLVDFLSVKVVDRIGYRPCVVAAHLFSAAGLSALAFLPQLLGNAYAGLMLAVTLYAMGGGLIEVLVSPIVEACPTDKKEAAMSLLHSFYCWGHVAVVLVSTAFFQLAGIGNWRIMACLWALLPLVNALYFSQVPIRRVVDPQRQLSVRSLFGQKLFWLLLLMMVCAGAAEQGMSQWASVFAESGLGVSKTIGDLAGPCGFALLMGTSRALYGKFSERLPLRAAMTASAVMCIVCYAIASWSGSPVLALVGCALCGFSVGIFWPGTFSTAVPAIPGGGTAMFALMALAGDLGCASGPTVIGFVAGAAGGRLTAGLAVGMVFPAAMLCACCCSQGWPREKLNPHEKNGPLPFSRKGGRFIMHLVSPAASGHWQAPVRWLSQTAPAGPPPSGAAFPLRYVHHNAPVVHHDEPISVGDGVAHVVGDHQCGQVVALDDALRGFQHLGSGLGVQGCGVFVRSRSFGFCSVAMSSVNACR